MATCFDPISPNLEDEVVWTLDRCFVDVNHGDISVHMRLNCALHDAISVRRLAGGGTELRVTPGR